MIGRRLNQFLAVVVLPLYLVAGNHCSLSKLLATGCAGQANDACVAAAADTEVEHHSRAHGRHCAAPEPADRGPGEDGRAGASCCDLVANALVPSAADQAPSSPQFSHHAVIPAIAEVPALRGLGVALIPSGLPPPARAGITPRGRAPPLV